MTGLSLARKSMDMDFLQGDVIFEENFSDAKSVEVDLHFHVQITVDNGINRYFANYSKERIKLK